MKKELEKIQSLIYEIRGQKVMLDRDLAGLYGVEVKRLNESVKRNIKRFPPEFMFQLTDVEWTNLRSQFATFSKDTRKYRPFVFTEHGILMLSSVLNSDKAIEVNIQIMKIFVHMRHYVISQTDTNAQVAELRKLLMLHIESNENKFADHDEAISQIIRALNNLIEQPPQTKKIGFNVNDKSPEYCSQKGFVWPSPLSKEELFKRSSLSEARKESIYNSAINLRLIKTRSGQAE